MQKIGRIIDVQPRFNIDNPSAYNQGKVFLYFKIVPTTTEEINAISPNKELAIFISSLMGERYKVEIDMSRGTYPQEVTTLVQKLEYVKKLLVDKKFIFTKYSFTIEDYFADVDGDSRGLREIYDINALPVYSISRWYAGEYADDIDAMYDLERILKKRLANGYYMLRKPSIAPMYVPPVE